MRTFDPVRREKPLAGWEAAILDDEGHELPSGEVGRLAVRGPIACRYLDDERQDEYVQGAGTSPATPTYATPTATTGSRPVRTT